MVAASPPDTPAHDAPGPPWHRLWALSLILAIVAALLVGWIGYIASDDALYYRGAARWLSDPPFAGSDHWTTRFPVVVPFAAMIALLGHGYPAFAATALLFYMLLIAVMMRLCASIAGARSGWIAAILTATLPVVVASATTVGTDLAEASALLVGVMLLTGARAGPARGIAAGAAFGVAILCRETSVLPLAALGAIFLSGRPVERRLLVAAGLGIVLVLGAEAVFQYAATGDALRRYDLAFHHDAHIDRAANREGNLLLWAPVDPLLVLLVNDDFGLLFWVLPLAWWQGRGRLTSPRAIVLAAMALASFALVAVLVHKLVLNPRYFLLPALAGVAWVAAWLAWLAPARRTMIMLAMVGSNLLLLSAANVHPRWTMEVLVEASRSYPHEVVAADPHIVAIARESLAFAGRRNVAPGPAGPGRLVVVEADEAPAGRIVARYPAPPTRIGAMIRSIGLEPWIPAPIARRMFHPGADVVLVRTSAGACRRLTAPPCAA